jgi:hypothetical protein
MGLQIRATDSLGIHVTSWAAGSSSTWPFVTVPDFDLRGASARGFAKSMSVVLLPIVTDSLLLLVTKLAKLWHAFKLSVKSLLSLVWNSCNFDFVTVLVLLPTLELSFRGLVAVVAPGGSGGNSLVDSGSKTKWIFGLLRLAEDFGTEPLSLIATVLHALECMDWMELSSSSRPETPYSLP